METKCSAFWNHTNIRNDNNIFPCCRYKTPVAKFNGNVTDILHYAEYKKLREDSLNDVANPNCQKCYYEESLGKKSLRQQFNEDYNTDQINLQFLEVGLDNICNLTCDGCWDEFSSSWAKKSNSAIIVRSSSDIAELPSTVNKVLFLGGEPLMTTRHIRLLKLANRSELDVTYNTNGTFLLDNETIKLLDQCKHVKFILSLDGYGELNEKVRSGSKWNDILKFIDQINKLGYSLTVHTVIHKNNWHGLGELADFIKQLGLNWTTNVLTYPRPLDIANAEANSEITQYITSINIPDKEYILNHLRKN
jgi:sulfatase maturation enzyme AslB (radical SAM superfamily)